MTREGFHQESATVWICTDCMVLLANGDMPDKITPGQPEPLSAISDDDEITPGMVYADHECENPEDRESECDCETREFSWSHCEGCGSTLGGSRHAATIWWEVETLREIIIIN